MKTLRFGGQGARRLVLIPGNDLCAEFYAGLGALLADRGVATIALTLPGYDGVPPHPSPSWQTFANDLSSLVQSEPEPVILAGHSMGAILALLVAAGRDISISHLVMLEPAILPTRWLARRAAQRYLREVVQGDRRSFANHNGAFPRIHDERAFPASIIELYMRVRRNSDPATSEALFRTLPDLYPLPWRRVTCPSLVITGEGTGWQGRALGAWIARKLPEGKQQIVAGGAHWLANEVDHRVAEAICSWVTGKPE